MKRAQILHNPTAGDEEHSGKEIMDMMLAAGYDCTYASTKEKGWKVFDISVDFVVAAGGDGTIQKVAAELLKQKERKIPLAPLPLGTANNMSHTLGYTKDIQKAIAIWKQENIQPYDIGRITGIKDTEHFFEGMGYGIFPKLIRTMKSLELGDVEPEEELKKNLEELHKLLQEYEAKQCTIEVDGLKIEGKMLMMEIMNIKSVGPNLELAPFAQTDDGAFDIVLVTAAQRDKLSAYVENKLNGMDMPFVFDSLRGSDIKISHISTHIHVDDKLIKLNKGQEVNIKVDKGALNILMK